MSVILPLTLKHSNRTNQNTGSQLNNHSRGPAGNDFATEPSLGASDSTCSSPTPGSRLNSLMQSNAGFNTAFYAAVTEELLYRFYPKYCDQCNTLMTGRIATRPSVVRCTSCFSQKSRLSYTPLHCLRIPYWKFGWVAHESFKRFPNVLTTAEIHRRLDISYKSALLLKRRFQLFASEQQNTLRLLFRDELKANQFELPPNRQTDLVPILKDQSQVVNIDTMAIFSASQRTNKGRKRNKHGGLTASIYMNESLGGKQIGSLYQTIAVKNGPFFMVSVPDQKMNTLLPILQQFIPDRTPVFSDEGYKWYYNPNHRMVAHSKRSKDKRYRFAKNRWSKNGVHCQTAEGVQSMFKTAMRNYRYFRPEHSQLYANEFSFLKNAAYFGLYEMKRTTNEATTPRNRKLDCEDNTEDIPNSH